MVSQQPEGDKYSIYSRILDYKQESLSILWISIQIIGLGEGEEVELGGF